MGKREREGEKGVRITVTGLDVKENIPYSFIKVSIEDPYRFTCNA